MTFSGIKSVHLTMALCAWSFLPAYKFTLSLATLPPCSLLYVLSINTFLSVYMEHSAAPSPTNISSI